MTRGLAQPVEIRGAALSSSGVQIENRPDVAAPSVAGRRTGVEASGFVGGSGELELKSPATPATPNKVIGVVTSGDIAVYRDDVKSAIERGIAQRPNAVWVCLEPKSDRVTHDVMLSLNIEPVVLPMIDAWKCKHDDHGYDLRRTWRDNELLHLCDELIVFHKRTSSSPWRERAAGDLFAGRLFVVELGPAPKPKARAKRKPVGA